MIVTTCLGCGVDIPAGRTRCDACARPVERRRRNPARDRGDVRRHHRAAIEAHVRRFGWVCRQCRPHHATRDLTADDPIPLAHGGDPLQELVVGCRSWNSTKGGAVRGRR